MNKRWSDNPWFVRAMLVFLYFPFGLISLAVSRTMKRKVTAGIFYLYLHLIFLLVVMFFVAVFDLLSRGYNIQTVVDYLPYYLGENNLKLILAEMLFLLPFFMIPVLVSYFVSKKNERNKVTKKGYNQYNYNNSSSFDNNSETPHYPTPTNELSYEKVSLLTQNEHNYYEILRLIAEKYGYTVMSKIRFADIVNVENSVNKNTFEWWNKFKKISQKHVDFALVEKSGCDVKLIIEIDDLSHNRPDRIERDAFVDSVCEKVGIPILHITDMIDLEKKIIEKLGLTNNTI